jgi:hypothetical protein
MHLPHTGMPATALVITLLSAACCVLSGRRTVLQLAVNGWLAVVVLQRKQP